MKKTKLSKCLADTGLSLNRSIMLKKGFAAQQNDGLKLAGELGKTPTFDELQMEEDLLNETNKMTQESENWVAGLDSEKETFNKTRTRLSEWAQTLLPLVGQLIPNAKIDDNTNYLQLANTPAPNGTGSQAIMKKGGKIKANEGIPIPIDKPVKPITQQTDRRLYGYDLLNMAIAEGRNPKDIILNPDKGSGKLTYLDQLTSALGEEQAKLAYTAASVFSQKEGIDKMSKEERIKAFYGGLSNNPELAKLKEQVGAYNGTRSALSLFQTSPLMLPSDYVQNTPKQMFEEGGSIDTEDPTPKKAKTRTQASPVMFNSLEEREQTRNAFTQVAEKALSSAGDEKYLYKFGSVYDPQKQREITDDDSQQCINGICGLFEAAGVEYNAGSFGNNKRYVGNGTFFDNVLQKKEDIYMTTSPKVMDHLQYTSVRYTKDGKPVKYPTHSKAIYKIDGDNVRLIHNGGGKEFSDELIDLNALKEKIKNGDVIAYRYGKEVDQEALEKERKAGLSPEVLAGIEKKKLEAKKKQVRNETYRKLLADNPGTVSEQIDNFNDFQLNDKAINRYSNLLEGNRLAIPALAIDVSSEMFEKGIGKHLIDTLNNEEKVLEISEKYGISPFEATKMLKSAIGIAITESRGGSPKGLESKLKYAIEEMSPESIQRKLSVGPYQIRYNSLSPEMKKKVGTADQLYSESTATDALLDILANNKKYLENRLKQNRTKDMPELTKDNIWDYAPMLMNQLKNGKVNDTGFKYNTRAGQIKYIVDNLLVNKGKIKDRSKILKNGK